MGRSKNNAGNESDIVFEPKPGKEEMQRGNGASCSSGIHFSFPFFTAGILTTQMASPPGQ